MFIWIIAGFLLYVLIGIGLLIYHVINDPWGEFLLYVAPLFIVAYPYFILKHLLTGK
ncbi:hypothetical protein PP175_25725 (plasmid) [Aneurinibacillus sp. Ricciae_BoGa-3]|uniref:hypothetical protein n=1 Tax=Aneurinibacillus sp. Ricciae_BoGa-3 TaxID=3022697 RepID=UPI0023415C77|nr:hypothetical protein [Aneurinibacillus sp. Ricciae_BoGa-3]WCK57468.1 hypothetical protein PP175_25725 [Aneurinibacillus sp. Ricciae_BoGa-3]